MNNRDFLATGFAQMNTDLKKRILATDEHGLDGRRSNIASGFPQDWTDFKNSYEEKLFILVLICVIPKQKKNLSHR